MAAGNLRVSRRSCRVCGKATKFERNATVWGLGDLIMILCTLGAWVILRGLANGSSNPWCCATCGTPERASLLPKAIIVALWAGFVWYVVSAIC